MPQRFTPERLLPVISALRELRDQQTRLASTHAADVTAVESSHRSSALNLLHYLALRQQDLRGLQRELSALGLSSLGRTEAHAQAGVDAVLAALHRLAGVGSPYAAQDAPPVEFESGPAALVRHTRTLLGDEPRDRQVRIMVTMPTEAAGSYELVRDLLRGGMDVMRINTAHDDRTAWAAMVANLRRARDEVGRSCRVLLDLQGPKLRTGPIEPGPRVLHWTPRRDLRGAVIDPVRVRLVPAGRATLPPQAPADPRGSEVILPVDAPWLGRVAQGDLLAMRDCRGMWRRLRVDRVDERGPLLLADHTAFIETGAEVRRLPAVILDRSGASLDWDSPDMECGRVGELPAVEQALLLRPGDVLVLHEPGAPGRNARPATSDAPAQPARIPCVFPGVVGAIRVGERVLFDDGKIGGVVESASPGELHVRIRQARPQGDRLRPDKGINLPDSSLPLSALTDEDLDNLPFAVEHADMVGLSFVRTPQDVLHLERELDRCNGQKLGVVLKIENRQAFENLPQLLLTAMRSPPVGVMVARGDLAVELGFERLAEVQEQVLWLCEAAHVPVIWATQVLESLAKKGIPSRAEVTDAAMSGRAECVMLNKGPHMLQAVGFLNDVLVRMQAHQEKKRAMLRRLNVSHSLR